MSAIHRKVQANLLTTPPWLTATLTQECRLRIQKEAFAQTLNPISHTSHVPIHWPQSLPEYAPSRHILEPFDAFRKGSMAQIDWYWGGAYHRVLAGIEVGHEMDDIPMLQR
jgi:hypothetical protein